jgi:hydroxyacylglutathione hydrolase
MRVLAVPARTDNLIWLLVDDESKTAVVVDPADAAPVVAALAAHGLEPIAIWNTHHHGDHVGGNLDLLARWPGLSVFASRQDCGRIPGQTVELHHGDTARSGGLSAEVLFLPGHTRGHIAYVVAGDGAPAVFSGDVLFGGGCGRLFEGTAAEMQASLERLAALPDDTLVYCAHEYTWHNLRWAITVEPQNPALVARHARIAKDPTQRTVPLRLGEEKATNPMLRWAEPALAALARQAGHARQAEHAGPGAGADAGPDAAAVFAQVRAHKDRWQG